MVPSISEKGSTRGSLEVDHEREHSKPIQSQAQSINVANSFTLAREPSSGSLSGASSAAWYQSTPGVQYFHSRRVQRNENPQPVRKFAKDEKEKWLWIIPLCGLILGITITGLLIYLKIGGTKTYKFCPVLSDGFSSGELNSKVWTKEVEVGGYGYIHSILFSYNLYRTPLEMILPERC